ncbi:MAG: ribonuclease H family protein [Patescibacteria group bacterium]
MKSAKKYYAYRLPNGRSGVVDYWLACERLVSGTANARYRGFKTRAEAEYWLHAGAPYEPRPKKDHPPLEKGIYFDAGTGRGQGVEVSVTDEHGKDLLHLVLPKTKINKFGKHHLGGEATNNYGELLGLQCALGVAVKAGVRNIFGDSKLIIEYWSKGIAKKRSLPKKTVTLIEETAAARREFEKSGGRLGRVSGDINPADLGFH